MIGYDYRSMLVEGQVASIASAFEQVRANLLKLFVSNAQRLMDVVIERAVDLAHLVERRLHVFGAFEQLRLQVDGLSQATGTDQRVELGVAARATELVGEQIILN